MATELSIQGTAQTENSTTKDTTDSAGSVWDEFETVSRSSVINFSALIATGLDGTIMSFNDILTRVNDILFNWVIAVASGEQNRTMGTIIAKGKGKMVNVQATGQVGQQSTYSGSINVYGPMQTINIETMSFNMPRPVSQFVGANQDYIKLSEAIDADAFIKLVKIGYSSGYDAPTDYAELTQESGTIKVKLQGSDWCDMTVGSDLKTWTFTNFAPNTPELIINDIFI